MNLSWFKQAAQAINAGAGILSVLVPALGPLVARMAPSTAPAIQNINDELPGIAAILLQVQALGDSSDMTGPDKLKIAVPFVTQLVIRSPLALNKKIVDKERFTLGVTSLTEGVLDILKSFEAEASLPDPKTVTGAPRKA